MSDTNQAAKVKSRPILFSGPMVRAILDGRKTQTRRIVKPQPPDHAIEVFDWRAPHIAESLKASDGCYYNDMDGLHYLTKCPYGAPGDRLWVRESWREWPNPEGRKLGDDPCMYRASSDPNSLWKWKPSIHMPRKASRITLEITGVRVERLNEITNNEALAEGAGTLPNPCGYADTSHFACCKDYPHKPVERFQKLWESINGPDSWSANPWVWVIEFRRINHE